MKSLPSPEDFHLQVIRGLQTASLSITLSALYVGVTKDHEKTVISSLQSALSDPSRPDLQVRLILDYSRAHRDDSGFLSIFRSLLAAHGPRLQVFLYEMPSQRLQSSFLINRLPSWMREILGVYHCKYMLFDDTAVLTGANLSEEYFSNRQDRYYLIRDHRMLAYLNSFSDIVGKDCHRLTETGIDYRTSSGTMAEELEVLSKEFQLNGIPPPPLHAAGSAADWFQGDGMACMPLVQCADLGITHEEDTLSALLGNRLPLPPALSDDDSYSLDSVTMMSPYPNFSYSLLASCFAFLSTNTTGGWRILTASAESHGFANGQGVKKYIPFLHQRVLTDSLTVGIERFHEQYPSSSAASLADGVQLGLYGRPGWTFHGKGLWVEGSTGSKRLQGCYIGSSNLSYRSHKRDFELGFLFLHTGSAATGSKAGYEALFQADYDNIAKHLLKNQDGKGVQALYSNAFSMVKNNSRVLAPWERVLVGIFARIVKSLL